MEKQKTFCDGSSQRGFSMVNVTNGTDVAVGLVALESLGKVPHGAH